MRRVAVTGLGVVSAVGIGREAFWHALRATPTLSASDSGIQSGQIQSDARQARTMGRIARFALAAARLALEDGGIEPGTFRPEDCGVFLGANLDDINLLGLCRAFATAGVDPVTGEPDLARFARVALEILHPFDYLQALTSMPAAHVAILWSARGLNCSYVSHGISGAEAIGEAYLAVRDGVAECALAGGADSWLTPFGAWRRGILGGVPLHGASPRLGEGAGILLLEPLDGARARNARIYGEVAGYAKALEAEAFPRSCRGAGLARSMRLALTRAGVGPEEVDQISAHGEGSVEGDRLEARALREAFGPQALPRVQTTKSLTGHLGAASGAVEAAATLLAINRQGCPPFPRADEMDPELKSRGISSHGGSDRIRVALNIAFHPMGLAASLVFKDVPQSGRHGETTG